MDNMFAKLGPRTLSTSKVSKNGEYVPVKGRVKIELYKDEKKQWRWRFVAGNGRIIADSAEAYNNRKDCLNGIRIFQESAKDAKIETE